MTLNLDYLDVWNDYQSKYIHLKEQFIEISTPHISLNCLTTLKKNYNSTINSQRDTDNIKSLSDLIKVLENRAILRYNKIEPFKFIASEIVNDSILDQIISEYEVNIHSQLILPLFNIYKCHSITSTNALTKSNSSQQIVQSSNLNKASTSFNFKQQKIVFQRLSKDLDYYWRDLARFLDITESEIDEIDRNTNLQLNNKAFKALEIFGERSQPSTWQSKLKQALIIVRRRDLTELIDELLNINN